MYIEIENENPEDNDFPNNKGKDGARYYTRNQNVLMFKNGSKYPDKFQLNLVFGSSKAEQQEVGTIAKGNYFLTDDAFFLDMSNRGNASCDFSKLEPVTMGSIDKRIKALTDLKALLK